MNSRGEQEAGPWSVQGETETGHRMEGEEKPVCMCMCVCTRAGTRAYMCVKPETLVLGVVKGAVELV